MTSDYLLFGKPSNSQNEENFTSESDVIEAVLIKQSDWVKSQQLKESGMLISVSKMMEENSRKKKKITDDLLFGAKVKLRNQ